MWNLDFVGIRMLSNGFLSRLGGLSRGLSSFLGLGGCFDHIFASVFGR